MEKPTWEATISNFNLRRWSGEFDLDATAVAGRDVATPRRGRGGAGDASAEFEDRFEHRQEIGRGGMASVHRATDRKLLREVAVKVLEVRGRNISAPAARFLQEAQISSQLDHPNIAPIHDLGVDADGVPFLLMKLVRGDSLAAILDQAGSLRLLPAKLEELLRIMTKVCEAVSFAHSRGVVHCDIKPANIMVGSHGEVYLMDWGIACLLPGGEAHGGDQAAPVRVRVEGRYRVPKSRFQGTPNYMAPEQVRHHRPIDERTDVFLLGATLYHILAGQPPYPGKFPRLILPKATLAEFPAPEEVAGDTVPSRLSRIVRRAMAADPDHRHASARELQDELEQFLRGSWNLPVETFAPGEVIFREGEVGTTAYILTEGRCEVFTGTGEDRTVLREIGPGHAFGEIAVLSDKPRTASVKALDAVTVMTVTREIMAEGLGLSSWIGSFVVELAEHFREADARLRELEGHESPRVGAD